MNRSEIKRRKRQINDYVDPESRKEEISENQTEAKAALENANTEFADAQSEYQGFRATPLNGYRDMYRRLLMLTGIIWITDLGAQYALNTGAFPRLSPPYVLLVSACITAVISGFTNGLFIIKILDPRRPRHAVRIATITAVTSGALATIAGLTVLAARFIPVAAFSRLSTVVFSALIITSEALPVTAGAIYFAASVLNRPRDLEKRIAGLKQKIGRLEEFGEWLKKHQSTPSVVSIVKNENSKQ